MPNLSLWGASPIALQDAAHRAVSAWTRIQDRPVSVTVVRDGVDQTAQTVRIEYVPATASEELGDTGLTLTQRVVVFGVVDHPDVTVTDTDIAVGDRFRYDGRWFEISGIVTHPGEIQGYGDAQRYGP